MTVTEETQLHLRRLFSLAPGGKGACSPCLVQSRYLCKGLKKKFKNMSLHLNEIAFQNCKYLVVTSKKQYYL